MGQPSSSAVDTDDDAHSDFAATVASLPPEWDDRLPDAQANVQAAAAGADSEPDVTTPIDLSDEPTLQHIGRYALKHKLGEGGLGSVHEAWDPLLSRTVAVKTLQFSLNTPQRVALDAMFLNEARAVAGLSHPHIVTVYDAGLSAHGVYIAMERLQGRDLRQALASGWRPAPPQAAQLVRRVADALAYAHARGVVHCDIKPANIFLTRKDRPTVLDFGIARVAHGAQGAAVPALEGLVAGSPHYLAPEQLQGGTIDGRTDVYALGVVLYELLAGRKAFEGSTLEQIINAVLHGHPAPANELQRAVPPGLAGVAAKAMARAPEQRYASAAELAQALRPWQERSAHDDPALPAPAAQPRPRIRASRTPLWAGLSAAALLVITSVWLLWPAAPAEPAAQALATPTPVAAIPPPAPVEALAEPASAPASPLPDTAAASAPPVATAAASPPVPRAVRPA
ncbi:MAG: serine/threonine protein kinase, partial [Rubrivivax sp.]|nr:serine/threonine protein kinase [Rubrivivax sp.]